MSGVVIQGLCLANVLKMKEEMIYLMNRNFKIWFVISYSHFFLTFRSNKILRNQETRPLSLNLLRAHVDI